MQRLFKSIYFRPFGILIILVLLASLILEPIAFAAPVITDNSQPNVFPISIPRHLGRIEESFQSGRGEKTVFYIQDAHDSLEAQKNTAKMIQHLVTRGGVKTVYEEGYEGAVPTDEYFGFITDTKIREKVSYFFMDKLRIGGAEYAHINRFNIDVSREWLGMSKKALVETQALIRKTQDFKLIGADSIKLHLENIAKYRKAAKIRKKIQADLDALSFEIGILSHQFFPLDFKDWLKLKERYEQRELPLLEYLKRSWVKIHEQERGRFPFLRLMLAAEKTKNENLTARFKAVDAGQLFREVDELENVIARKNLKLERDQKTFHFYKILRTLNRLNSIEVTSGEYEAVKETLKTFNTRDLAEFISKTLRKPVFLSRRWETAIQRAIEFYEIAEKRNRAIDKCLDAFIADPEEKTAVLVYGGFHKDDIREFLHRKNLSYRIITPKISKSDPVHQAYYKQLMAVGHHPFEIPALVRQAARNALLWHFAPAKARQEIRNVYEGALRHPGQTREQIPGLIEKDLLSSRRSESRQAETAAGSGDLREELFREAKTELSRNWKNSNDKRDKILALARDEKFTPVKADILMWALVQPEDWIRKDFAELMAEENIPAEVYLEHLRKPWISFDVFDYPQMPDREKAYQPELGIQNKRIAVLWAIYSSGPETSGNILFKKLREDLARELDDKQVWLQKEHEQLKTWSPSDFVDALKVQEELSFFEVLRRMILRMRLLAQHPQPPEKFEFWYKVMMDSITRRLYSPKTSLALSVVYAPLAYEIASKLPGFSREEARGNEAVQQRQEARSFRGSVIDTTGNLSGQAGAAKKHPTALFEAINKKQAQKNPFLTPEDNQGIWKQMEEAQKQGEELSLFVPLRSAVFASGQDVLSTQRLLTPENPQGLQDLPSLIAFPHEKGTKAILGLARDDQGNHLQDSIQYVNQRLRINRITKVPMSLTAVTLKTPEGQADAVAYILGNIFGLRGISIEIQEQGLALSAGGGFENSNVYDLGIGLIGQMLSQFSGKEISSTELISLLIRAASNEFDDMTGGQGILTAYLGANRFYFYGGILGPDGQPLAPTAVLAEPLPADLAGWLNGHSLILQPGQKYFSGVAEERNDYTSRMMIDVTGINHPRAYEKAQRMLELSEIHHRALLEKDLDPLNKAINEYTDIRIWFQVEWLKLAQRQGQPFYETRRLNPFLNSLPPFDLQKPREPEAKDAPYLGGHYEVLKRAREKYGLAVMPMGKGSFGSNWMLFGEVSAIERFKREAGYQELTDEETKKQTIAAGAHEIRGWMLPGIAEAGPEKPLIQISQGLKKAFAVSESILELPKADISSSSNPLEKDYPEKNIADLPELSPEQEASLQAAAESLRNDFEALGLYWDPLNEVYLRQMMRQRMMSLTSKVLGRPIKLSAEPGGSFHLLAEAENKFTEKEYGQIPLEKILKKAKRYRAAARKTTLRYMNGLGGHGGRTGRREMLAVRKGVAEREVNLGTKGTDIGIELELKLENGEKTILFLSIFEIQIRRLIQMVGEKTLKAVDLEALVNLESNGEIQKILEFPFWDFKNPTKPQKTYREVLADKGIRFLKPAIQANLPGREVQSNLVASAKETTPHAGGTGYWFFKTVDDLLKLPETDEPEVWMFIGGDNAAAPIPEVVGYVIETNVPILQINTTNTLFDRDAGRTGWLDLETQTIPDIIEPRDIARMPSAPLIYSAGQPGGYGREGKQTQNTNMYYINRRVVRGILSQVLEVLGEKQKNILWDMITPDFILNLPEDGAEPIDGAFASSVHRLNRYLVLDFKTDPRLSDDQKQKIAGILSSFRLTRLLHFVNIPEDQRTSWYFPVKNTFSAYLLSTDRLKFDTRHNRFKDPEKNLPLVSANLLSPDPKYYEDELRLRSVFGAASFKHAVSFNVAGSFILTDRGISETTFGYSRDRGTFDSPEVLMKRGEALKRDVVVRGRVEMVDLRRGSVGIVPPSDRARMFGPLNLRSQDMRRQIIQLRDKGIYFDKKDRLILDDVRLEVVIDEEAGSQVIRLNAYKLPAFSSPKPRRESRAILEDLGKDIRTLEFSLENLSVNLSEGRSLEFKRENVEEYRDEWKALVDRYDEAFERGMLTDGEAGEWSRQLRKIENYLEQLPRQELRNGKIRPLTTRQEARAEEPEDGSNLSDEEKSRTELESFWKEFSLRAAISGVGLATLLLVNVLIYLPLVEDWMNQNPLHIIPALLPVAVTHTLITFIASEALNFIQAEKEGAAYPFQFRKMGRAVLLTSLFSVPVYNFFIFNQIYPSIPDQLGGLTGIVRAILHQGILAPILFNPMGYLIGKVVIEGHDNFRRLVKSLRGEPMKQFTLAALIFWGIGHSISLAFENPMWILMIGTITGFFWNLFYYQIIARPPTGSVAARNEENTFSWIPAPLQSLYDHYYQPVQKYLDHPHILIRVLSGFYFLYAGMIAALLYYFEQGLISPMISFAVSVLFWIKGNQQSRHLVFPSHLKREDLKIQLYSMLSGEERAKAERFLEEGFTHKDWEGDAWVAFYENQVAGVYRFEVFEGHEGSGENNRIAAGRGIRVTENFRGLGVGTELRIQLLQHLKDKIKAEVFRFRVDRGQEAQDFAKRLIGLKGVTPSYFPEGGISSVEIRLAKLDLEELRLTASPQTSSRKEARSGEKEADALTESDFIQLVDAPSPLNQIAIAAPLGVYPRTRPEHTARFYKQSLDYINQDRGLLRAIRENKAKLEQKKEITALVIGSGAGLDGMVILDQLLNEIKSEHFNLDLIDIKPLAVKITARNFEALLKSWGRKYVLQEQEGNYFFMIPKKGTVRVALASENEEFKNLQSADGSFVSYDLVSFNAPNLSEDVPFGWISNGTFMERPVFVELVSRVKKRLAPGGFFVVGNPKSARRIFEYRGYGIEVLGTESPEPVVQFWRGPWAAVSDFFEGFFKNERVIFVLTVPLGGRAGSKVWEDVGKRQELRSESSRESPLKSQSTKVEIQPYVPSSQVLTGFLTLVAGTVTALSFPLLGMPWIVLPLGGALYAAAIWVMRDGLMGQGYAPTVAEVLEKGELLGMGSYTYVFEDPIKLPGYVVRVNRGDQALFGDLQPVLHGPKLNEEGERAIYQKLYAARLVPFARWIGTVPVGQLRITRYADAESDLKRQEKIESAQKRLKKDQQKQENLAVWIQERGIPLNQISSRYGLKISTRQTRDLLSQFTKKMWQAGLINLDFLPRNHMFSLNSAGNPVISETGEYEIKIHDYGMVYELPAQPGKMKEFFVAKMPDADLSHGEFFLRNLIGTPVSKNNQYLMAEDFPMANALFGELDLRPAARIFAEALNAGFGVKGQGKLKILEILRKEENREVLDGVLEQIGRKIDNLRFSKRQETRSFVEKKSEFGRFELRANKNGMPPAISRMVDQAIYERKKAYEILASWQPAVTIFGGARVPREHPYYELGVLIGKAIARRGLALRTGAANIGLMEAPLEGHTTRKRRGVQRQGIRIQLPFEQHFTALADEIGHFNYFHTRKIGLHENILGAIALPGGFGTLDEVFEVWRRGRPLVLLGREFWEPLFDSRSGAFYKAWKKAGIIRQLDSRIRPLITDDLEDALDYLKQASAIQPPYLPKRDHLRTINQDLDTNLYLFSKLPEAVTFVGRPDPRKGTYELNEAVKLAGDLHSQYHQASRVATRGILLEHFLARSKKQDWNQSLQALVFGKRISGNGEAVLEKAGRGIFVEDESNHQFLLTLNSSAYVFLPGGVGTLNRFFDLLTIMQTGKMPKKPIYLLGSKFWGPIKKQLVQTLLDRPDGMKLISVTDPGLLNIVDSALEIQESLEERGVIARPRQELRTSADVESYRQEKADEIKKTANGLPSPVGLKPQEALRVIDRLEQSLVSARMLHPDPDLRNPQNSLFLSEYLSRMRARQHDFKELNVLGEKKSLMRILSIALSPENGFLIFEPVNTQTSAPETAGYLIYTKNTDREENLSLSLAFDIFPDYRAQKNPGIPFSGREMLGLGMAALEREFQPEEFSLFAWNDIYNSEVADSVEKNAAFYLKAGFYPGEKKNQADELLEKIFKGGLLNREEALKLERMIWTFPFRQELRSQYQIPEAFQKILDAMPDQSKDSIRKAVRQIAEISEKTTEGKPVKLKIIKMPEAKIKAEPGTHRGDIYFFQNPLLSAGPVSQLVMYLGLKPSDSVLEPASLVQLQSLFNKQIYEIEPDEFMRRVKEGEEDPKKGVFLLKPQTQPDQKSQSPREELRSSESESLGLAEDLLARVSVHSSLNQAAGQQVLDLIQGLQGNIKLHPKSVTITDLRRSLVGPEVTRQLEQFNAQQKIRLFMEGAYLDDCCQTASVAILDYARRHPDKEIEIHYPVDLISYPHDYLGQSNPSEKIETLKLQIEVSTDGLIYQMYRDNEILKPELFSDENQEAGLPANLRFYLWSDYQKMLAALSLPEARLRTHAGRSKSRNVLSVRAEAQPSGIISLFPQVKHGFISYAEAPLILAQAMRQAAIDDFSNRQTGAFGSTSDSNRSLSIFALLQFQANGLWFTVSPSRQKKAEANGSQSYQVVALSHQDLFQWGDIEQKKAVSLSAEFNPQTMKPIPDNFQSRKWGLVPYAATHWHSLEPDFRAWKTAEKTIREEFIRALNEFFDGRKVKAIDGARLNKDANLWTSREGVNREAQNLLRNSEPDGQDPTTRLEARLQTQPGRSESRPELSARGEARSKADAFDTAKAFGSGRSEARTEDLSQVRYPEIMEQVIRYAMDRIAREKTLHSETVTAAHQPFISKIISDYIEASLMERGKAFDYFSAAEEKIAEALEGTQDPAERKYLEAIKTILEDQKFKLVGVSKVDIPGRPLEPFKLEFVEQSRMDRPALRMEDNRRPEVRQAPRSLAVTEATASVRSEARQELRKAFFVSSVIDHTLTLVDFNDVKQFSDQQIVEVVSTSQRFRNESQVIVYNVDPSDSLGKFFMNLKTSNLKAETRALDFAVLQHAKQFPGNVVHLAGSQSSFQMTELRRILKAQGISEDRVYGLAYQGKEAGTLGVGLRDLMAGELLGKQLPYYMKEDRWGRLYLSDLSEADPFRRYYEASFVFARAA